MLVYCSLSERLKPIKNKNPQGQIPFGGTERAEIVAPDYTDFMSGSTPWASSLRRTCSSIQAYVRARPSSSEI